MRYHIVEVKYKREKVSVKCMDTQEKALLKISLNPYTLECMDSHIPEILQNFVQLNQENIRTYLLTVNDKTICIG